MVRVKPTDQDIPAREQPVFAFLLSAGFGTRLRPLTEQIPKPMIVVQGKPLIQWNLELLAKASIRKVFINLHYRGDQIERFVGDGSAFGLEVEYSNEPNLLDTGGGIKNLEGRIPEPGLLVTINSDALFGRNFQISDLIRAHCAHAQAPLATLVLRPDPESRAYGEICVDREGRIRRFLDTEQKTDSLLTPYMFSGAQVMSTEVFRYMPEKGKVFSLTRDTYRTLIRDGHFLSCFLYTGYWSDIGTPDRLQKASEEFKG